jgi:hypothetical protein
MMPTVTERDTTVVSLTCKAIHDMDADEQHGESYTKLSNVTVKTSDGTEKRYPDSCLDYCENPMSHHYSALIEVGGGNSYVSRDGHGRPLHFQFTQLKDNSWLGVLPSPALQQAAERQLFGWPGTGWKEYQVGTSTVSRGAITDSSGLPERRRGRQNRYPDRKVNQCTG